MKAWTDMISLRNIPINRKEQERLKHFEQQQLEDNRVARQRAAIQKQKQSKDSIVSNEAQNKKKEQK